MKNSILFFAAFLAVGFASCKKDDEKTKTELLTAVSKWGWYKVQVELNGGTPVDATKIVKDECDLDDLYTFAKDKTCKIDVGDDDCDGADEDGMGTWTWLENETILSFTIDGDEESWQLVSLNSSQLKVVLYEDVYDFDGDGEDDNVKAIAIFNAK